MAQAETPKPLAAESDDKGREIVALPAPAAGSQAPAAPPQISTEEVVQKALATTVLIQTDLGLGSGFFLDGQGMVVTNYHVIEGASGIGVITQDQKAHQVVAILHTLPQNDIAILQTTAIGYPVLPMAAREKIKPGATVFAVGNPLGLDWSVSNGIVSNPSRKVKGITLVQHTAPISPGNSGGPLVLATGEVAGMNTASVADPTAQNLNLAVNVQDVVAAQDVARHSSGTPVAGEAPSKPSSPAAPSSGSGAQPSSPGAGTGQRNPEVDQFLTWVMVEFAPAYKGCVHLMPSSEMINRGPFVEAREKARATQACFDRLVSTMPFVLNDQPHYPARNALFMGLLTYKSAFFRLELALASPILGNGRNDEGLQEYDRLLNVGDDYMEQAVTELEKLSH